MKIELDKALLWLLPYLYLVSVCYYWGYWGVFGIDAFSYYEVSDLVKGIIAPINSPIVLLTTIFSLFAITFAFARFMSNKASELNGVSRIVMLVVLFSSAIIIPLILRWVLHYLAQERNRPAIDNYTYNIVYGTALSQGLPLLLAFVLFVYYIVSIDKDKLPSEGKVIFTLLSVMTLSILPGQGYMEGKELALLIKQNKKYDYVIKDSIAVPQKSIYKYLGKAGDHHILISKNDSTCIVVSTDKLDPLVLEHFSVNDTTSAKRLKFHTKKLLVK